MNKRFLSLFIALSLSIHAHAFTIKPYIDAAATRITNAGRIAKNATASMAEETARIIYTESVANLGEHTIASLIQHVPFTLDRSKKSRLLSSKIHARIYITFANNFLKEFLTHFDIDTEQFINDLPCDAVTKNEYKTRLYEKLYALTITTEHSKIDEHFKVGFSQYKKQYQYDEVLKCNMQFYTVATILLAGILCKLTAESLIHIVRLLTYWDTTPFYIDFLRDLILNPNNELLFHVPLMSLETLFPTSPSSQGTYLWKYGLKSSDETIKKAKIVGSLIIASLFTGKVISEAKYGNIDFFSAILIMKIGQECYNVLKDQFLEPEKTES